MKDEDKVNGLNDGGDDFEACLRRQRIRSVPAEWRAEILRRAADHEGEVLCASGTDGLTTGESRMPLEGGKLRGWLDRWWVRIPVPGLGVAVVWAMVVLGASMDRWLHPNGSRGGVTVSREQVAEAQAQRLLLLELAGLEDPTAKSRVLVPPNRPVVDRPRPRSQVRPEKSRGVMDDISTG